MHADLTRLASLQKVDLSDNLLETIELDADLPLNELAASDNALRSIDLGRLAALVSLNLSHNPLETLDPTANADLQTLAAEGGKFKTLEIGHLARLKTVRLTDGALETLSVSGMERLQRLEAGGNTLPTLTVTNCPALETVCADRNGTVDVTFYNVPRLTELDLSDNNLLSLELKGLPALLSLDISGNNARRDDGSGYLRAIDLSPCTSLVRLKASDTPLETLLFPSNPALRELAIERADRLTRINLKNDAFPAEAAYRIAEGNTSLTTVLTDTGPELDYVRELFATRPDVTVTDDDTPGPGPVTGFVPQPAPTDRPDDEDQNPESFGYFMTFPNLNLIGGTLEDAKSEEERQGCPFDQSKTAAINGFTAYTFLVNGTLVIYRTYYVDADMRIRRIVQYVPRQMVLVLRGGTFVMNPNFPVDGWPALTEEEPSDGYYNYSCSSNGSRIGIRAVMIGDEELGELVYTLME